jgi:5-methylcytosine-specific restriction protein A
MTRYTKATAYHYLYDSKAWKGRRVAQLSAYPLCAFCERMGKFVSATVADHIEPHKGDDVLFFEGELQSLCKACHDGAKQREENAGFSSAVDVDGYPIDPRHPSNR